MFKSIRINQNRISLMDQITLEATRIMKNECEGHNEYKVSLSPMNFNNIVETHIQGTVRAGMLQEIATKKQFRIEHYNSYGSVVIHFESNQFTSDSMFAITDNTSSREVYKSKQMIRDYEAYDYMMNTDREGQEKYRIMKFLESLPIEKLKSIVNFELIDPRNVLSEPEDDHLRELIMELFYNKSIQINMSTTI